MKAMVVRAYGAPEVIRHEDVETPKPGRGEVLVEVHAVTVNRARDTMIANGIPNKPETLPLVPGMDPAGRIAKLGEGVTGIAIGDRVDTGTWYQNRCDFLDPALAWTGVKLSGRGCTLSALGYEALTRPKSFHLRTKTQG